jgi:drug/metabolite transporter (DMT)-like permease
MQKNIFIILIATILMFGIGWPISKIGLEYMPPVTFAATRLVIGTICMFLYVIVTKNFIWPTKKDIPIILAIGFFQVGFFILFIHLGLKFVEAGRSTILVYTTPIWVTPIAIFFFKESAGLLKWLGLVFGMIGLIILFGPNSINWADPNVIMSNAVLLLAALSWAISMLCARYMQWPHSPLQLFPWQLLVGTIPMLILMLFELPTMPILWNKTLIGALLFTGIFPQGFGALGVLLVSKALPSITVSLCLLAVPVMGLIFSSLLLGETITMVNLFAITFIVIGLICTTLDERYHHAP